jgi:hypothetical protein
MQNIATGIISITIAIVIIYVLGRITIIISDGIQVKQYNKKIPIQQIILQALKKRHSAFDYGLMGFLVAGALGLGIFLLGLGIMVLELLGDVINQAI